MIIINTDTKFSNVNLAEFTVFGLAPENKLQLTTGSDIINAVRFRNTDENRNDLYVGERKFIELGKLATSLCQGGKLEII